MNIIIPMAGRGSRLRPHTLTTPKPLLPVAGKAIVQRLAEDIVEIYHGKVEEIAFVVGDFGEEVNQELLKVATALGAKGSIFRQEEPLGTAHAIWQAESLMTGEVIIAFADTLFRADFELDKSKDGVIWVKNVSNPESFGVVTLDGKGIISEMIEKPKEFVSDLAIIGIYYIKDGPSLRNEIKYLLDNDLKEKGEFQLTNALETLKKKGAQFLPGKVDDWMDCGNKDNVLYTNKMVLEYSGKDGKNLVSDKAVIKNSTIIPPCFIGDNVTIENSVIGPHVSIGNNTRLSHSVVSMSLIQENSEIENCVLNESMIGNQAKIIKKAGNINIGDFCITID